MRTVSQRHHIHPGILRHLHIVRGIAHHQGAPGASTQLIHKLEQHCRIGLGQSLICRAGRMKIIFHAGGYHYPLQSRAALAGGHTQLVTCIVQLRYRFARAIEQRNRLILCQKMMAITLHQIRPHRLRQIRHGIAQRLIQTQADYVTRRFIIRNTHTQIAAGSLN